MIKSKKNEAHPSISKKVMKRFYQKHLESYKSEPYWSIRYLEIPFDLRDSE